MTPASGARVRRVAAGTDMAPSLPVANCFMPIHCRIHCRAGSGMTRGLAVEPEVWLASAFP